MGLCLRCELDLCFLHSHLGHNCCFYTFCLWRGQSTSGNGPKSGTQPSLTGAHIGDKNMVFCLLSDENLDKKKKRPGERMRIEKEEGKREKEKAGIYRGKQEEGLVLQSGIKCRS